MATLTVSNVTLCAGGGHVHADVRLNQGQARSVAWDADDLRASPSAQDVLDAVKVVVKAHLMGMTRAQARAALEAGITISVGA